MANIRYKDHAALSGSLQDTDRVPMDKDTGAGSFATHHFTPLQMLAYVIGNLEPMAGAYILATADYDRDDDVGFIDADATAGAMAVDLGTPGTFPVEVRKNPDDATFNEVTITYGLSTLVMNLAGQTAKFVPSGSDWILWTRSF